MSDLKFYQVFLPLILFSVLPQVELARTLHSAFPQNSSHLQTTQAYKPFADFILGGNAAEYVYILDRVGDIRYTNTGVKQMPKYSMQIENEFGTGKTTVQVDEKETLLEALSKKGVTRKIYGVRLNNEKYYPVKFDSEKQALYLVKLRGGACIVKTNQLIIIGTFNSSIRTGSGAPQNPAQLNDRVQALAKNIKNQGL